MSTLELEVMSDLGGDLLFGYQHFYDFQVLEKNFTKVFSVKRALDLEVATVWRRK